MWFMLFFLAAMAAIAYGLEWIFDHPGSLTLDWLDLHIETSAAVAALAVLLAAVALNIAWGLLWRLVLAPGRWREGRLGRLREKGFQAISRGLVAVGSGDVGAAQKATKEAERHLPTEPLTQYLKAQSAQLSGERGKAESVFQEMTLSPHTKLLGLRGLHIEAKRRDDVDAAQHFAREAHAIAPLPWAGASLMEHQAAQGDWRSVLATIDKNVSAKALDAASAQRLRAVAETALATQLLRENPSEALHVARLALKRRPGFTPAALVAARVLLDQHKRKAAQKLIEDVWSKAPHPELGDFYAEAVAADSNTQTLRNVERLVRVAPTAVESRHLWAKMALAARDFGRAREALSPLIGPGARPTAHSCLLMAEIEDAELGPSGPVREWLARGSRAPRDPVWIADGVVSPHWAPFSPKTGRLDAFEWAAPPDSADFAVTDARANIPPAFLTRAEAPTVIPAPSEPQEPETH